MEELLNKLIEKGWKPRNVISKNTYIYKVEDKINLSYSEFLEDEGEVMHEDEWYSLRDLVSKSSGLWQFVCENKLTIVKHPNKNKYPRDKLEREEHRDWTREQGYYGEPVKQNKWYNWDTAEYRLIESALCDEDKLEQFLLDNIKIDE